MKQDRASGPTKVCEDKSTQATFAQKVEVRSRCSSLDSLYRWKTRELKERRDESWLSHARSSNDINRWSGWSGGEGQDRRVSWSRKHSYVVSDESMYTGSEESIEDSDCKKLAAVNQELYKMWQKNKEENESLKIQLEEFKKKLKFSQDKLKDVSEKVRYSPISL